MPYTIKPLNLGTIIRKKSNMVYNCGSDELTPFPLIAFLLEGEGRKVIVDTGGSAPDGEHWMPYTRKPEEEIHAALKAAGTSAEDIDAVFFTHLHWDHAGGGMYFPNAKHYVQKAEYLPIKEKDLKGYERDLVLLSEYDLLDGDVDNVLPGISVVFSPGHSLGSQSIIVDTEDGKKVLAGDLIPTYENIEFHVPNGVNYDINVIQKNMDKVCSLGYPIIPGHEMKLFSDSQC